MPGGSHRNLAWGAELLEPGAHDETDQLIVADAQTSGGLIFGVDPAHTAQVLAGLQASGHTAAHIGQAAPGTPSIELR